MMRKRSGLLAAAVWLLLATGRLMAAPRVEILAPNLYAYVSDNDHSSNSTFLVGNSGILVVDTGLNAEEGKKLLGEIRKVSPLPVRFIINTHYHPDHQGGDAVVGPDAVIITSPFTRERTEQLIRQMGTGQHESTATTLRLATLTFANRLTVYLDGEPVEVIAPGPAHTMGDVYVYFPHQRTVATGDLFMGNSCPAMDQGSAVNWVRALDAMLALDADHFVPGHFELGSRQSATRFRDYLADLTAQVQRLRAAGVAADQLAARIDASKYSDFRQFPQFHATFADNAAAIYKQLAEQR